MPLWYALKTTDGRTFEGILGVTIVKTMDRRNDWAQPELVYEATGPTGVVERLWPEMLLPGEDGVRAEMR